MVAASSTSAATNIYNYSYNSNGTCPGQPVTVTVNYCQNLTNSNSYFFAALNTSDSATLLPCGDASQFFVVDSNGINVADTTPSAGWNSLDALPVTFCRPITWVFNIPSNAVLGTRYMFVMAGRTGGLDCSTPPDSQIALPVTVCSALPTSTPTFTKTISPTISITPTPNTPTPTPTATFINTPVYTMTVVLSDTPTYTPTPTPTPWMTQTPTDTPTPSGPITLIYTNGSSTCSAAFGCTVQFVNACRLLYLDSQTSYIIMRLGATCGCQPSDIMQLRLTMSWDEICAHYGLDWSTFVTDLQTRIATLAPEVDTPIMIMRADANDPSQYPMTQPVPMPDHLIYAQAVTEVVPVCH